MDKILKFNNDEILKNLNVLEAKRACTARRIRAAKALCFVLMLLLCVTLTRFWGDILIAGILSVAFALIVYYVTEKRIASTFTSSFKDNVLSLVARDEGLSYEHSSGISAEEFFACDIYRQDFDNYAGKDLFAGKFLNINVKFSDVCIQKCLTGDSHAVNKMRDIFYGTVFVAEFPAPFACELHVIDADDGDACSRLARQKVDSAEFEAYFCTFSNDAVATKLILAPKFAERLTALRDHFRAQTSLCFNGSRAFIYVRTGRDSFEPVLTEPLLASNSCAVTLKDKIQEFLNIVEFLKSNPKAFSEKI